MMSTLQQHDGRPCPYCAREMDITISWLAPTRDHYPVPRSRGGQKTIICCRKCNEVKGDMSAAEWLGFRARNPEWWEQRNPKKRVRIRHRRIIEAETPSTPMRAALSQHSFMRLVSQAFDEKFVGVRRDPDEAD